MSLIATSLSEDYVKRLERIEGLMGDLMSEVENMEEVAKEKKSVAAAETAADSELISAMENTLRKRGMLPDADETVVERRSDGDFVVVPYKKRLSMALEKAVDKVITEQKRGADSQVMVERRADGDLVVIPTKPPKREINPNTYIAPKRGNVQFEGEKREEDVDKQDMIDSRQLQHSMLTELEAQKREQQKLDYLMEEMSDAKSLDIARRAEELRRSEIKQFANYLEKKEHAEKIAQEKQAVLEQRDEQIRLEQLDLLAAEKRAQAEKNMKREMARQIEAEQIRADYQRRDELRSQAEQKAENSDMKRGESNADVLLSKLRSLLQNLV